MGLGAGGLFRGFPPTREKIKRRTTLKVEPTVAHARCRIFHTFDARCSCCLWFPFVVTVCSLVVVFDGIRRLLSRTAFGVSASAGAQRINDPTWSGHDMLSATAEQAPRDVATL